MILSFLHVSCVLSIGLEKDLLAGICESDDRTTISTFLPPFPGPEPTPTVGWVRPPDPSGGVAVHAKVSGAEEMRSLAKQLVQNYRQCRDRFRHKPLEPQVDPLSWIGLIVVLALPLVLLWVFCMFRERPKLLAGDASPNFCIHLVDGTQRSFHEFLCQRHVPTLLVFYHTLQPLGKDEGHLLKVFQELEEIDQLVSYRDEDLQCIMVNVESMQKLAGVLEYVSYLYLGYVYPILCFFFFLNILFFFIFS